MSTQGETMANVTDADREKAAKVEYEDADETGNWIPLHDRIAAALAEEREKARAPFLTVLHRWAIGDDVTRMWLAKEFRESMEQAEVTE